MSRMIDEERPFTKEDIEYLRTRPQGAAAIEINERKFGHLNKSEVRKAQEQAAADDADEEKRQTEQAAAAKQEEDDSFDEEDIAHVAPLTVKQLRERLDKLKMDTSGNKEELQLRLLEHLDRERHPEQYEETE